MNYEKAWETLKANFKASLMEQLELGREEDKDCIYSAIAALLTMQKLEELYSKEKDDYVNSRPRVEN